MEEASVAGESPDRSRKRESSAEATSGSTGPVPEARTEARDPRLAVARETDASGGSAAVASGGSAGSAGSASGKAESSGGGVDTATKVFSVRDLDREVDAVRDSQPEPEPEPEADAVPESEAEAAEESGRESGERAASGGDVSADAADGPGEDAATDEGAPEDSGDATDNDSPEDSGDAMDSDAAVDSDDATDSDAPDDSDDATDSDAPGGSGDDRLRAAVAAWVRTGDSKGSEGTPGPETAPERAGTDGSADSEAPDSPEDASARSGTDTDGERNTDADASGGERDAEDVAKDEAEPADTATGESAGDDEAGGRGDGEGDASAKAEADADADAEVVEDAVPERGGDSSPASDAPGAPEDAAPAGSGGSADGSSVEDAVQDAVPEGDGKDGKAAGARHVDQPTAVFKRPPKPQVDQPTTMLKLGGAAKTPERAPGKTRETDAPHKPDGPNRQHEPVRTPEAERTSKFVALKPLDEPSTRKPADATAAIPQVGPERTAQQPLPPKPPMDLLAELTNTPPPPVTPVRTIVRRVKIWTPLVLLLAVVFAIAQAVRPLPTPTLALTADDSYTFDGSKADLPWPSEGQGWMDVNGIGTMGNFGKQTPVAIGSVAKAMTAYIILREHPLKPGAEGAKIKVDATAEKEGGYDKDGESTLNTVKQGDTLTEKQALSAVMIPSANNIARLLARWDAGTEAAFIKKMNDTAKHLGMKNTTYTDASGLKESTVSTAEDQVKLGNELVKIPALMDITKLPNWTDPSGHKWRNYNALVPYNGALGIKTGTTTKAGGNLLFAAAKEVGGETVTVVGAILGQHTAPIIDTVNAVSKTALLGAQDALTSKKILKKGDVVGYVDDQLGDHTPIVLTKDVPAVGWAGLKVKLSFDADDVPHSAKAGTRVGTLTVGDGTSGAVKVPVALQKDLTEPGFGAKLKRIT